MNKKILGIGIMALIVIGLIILGRRLTRPQAPIDTAAPVTADAAPQADKPAATPPPKATAKPKTSIAAISAAPEGIILDLSTQFARDNKDILEKYIKNPADFDSHYVVAKWQCDDDCTFGAVIDLKTGKVYMAPAEHPGNKKPGLSYQYYSLNSNLYRVLNGDIIETYSFDGARFTLVSNEKF